jgi:hypothetical protein
LSYNYKVASVLHFFNPAKLRAEMTNLVMPSRFSSWTTGVGTRSAAGARAKGSWSWNGAAGVVICYNALIEINLDGRRRSRWTIAEEQVVRATR